MALTPQQIERKLDRHGNDIESIYELLAGIQAKLTTHDTRFDTIDSQLGAIHAALAETLRRLPEPPVN